MNFIGCVDSLIQSNYNLRHNRKTFVPWLLQKVAPHHVVWRIYAMCGQVRYTAKRQSPVLFTAGCLHGSGKEEMSVAIEYSRQAA